MFSQLLKLQRQHSIIANIATMPVCEDKLVSWLPEQNNEFGRGYDTKRVLGEMSV